MGEYLTRGAGELLSAESKGAGVKVFAERRMLLVVHSQRGSKEG
jgi:hypothetical protein